MEHVTSEVWVKGRRGELACVSFTEYEDGYTVASAESEHITQHQFETAIRKAHPGILFTFEHDKRNFYYYARTL